MVKFQNLPLQECIITSYFGPRQLTVKGVYYWWHNGIDLKAMNKTPIYAVADGVVKIAKINTGSYGNYIVIDHGKFGTLYAHLSKLNTVEGKQIYANDLIGYTGDTGAVTAPHLHFELRICDYEHFFDRCQCDKNVYMRCVDAKGYIDECRLKLEDITIEDAKIIVQKSAGLQDKTIEYIANDYRYGDELIKKLAQAIR